MSADKPIPIPPVLGYRPLNQAQVDLVNEGKALALQVQAYARKVEAFPEIDPRWLSIGKTNLQQGFMAVYRAVFKPDGF